MSVTDTAVALLGGSAQAGAEELHNGTHRTTLHPLPVDELAAARARRQADHRTDFRRWLTRYVRVLVGCDAVAAIIAVAATAAFPGSWHPGTDTGWLLTGTVAAVVWPLLVAVCHGYERRQLGAWSESRAVLKAMAVIIVLGALLAAWAGLDPMLGLVAAGAPAAALTSTAVRFIVHSRLRSRQRSGERLRQVIMVGGVSAVRELCEAVGREHAAGIEIAGVCVPAADLQRAQAMGLPVVGDIDHVARIATELDCHAVAVTGADATRQSFLRQLAWSLEDVDVDLFVHPGLVDVARPRMQIQSFTGLPMLHVEQPHFAGWSRRVKRLTDIVLTSIGLLLIAPLLAAIALAIKLDDRRGPVIFKQTRVGIDGKPFTMYKFRSMVVDAEKRLADLKEQNEGAGPLFKIENDPRVTRIGHFLRRYSLDELPQLFNVLTGSMSLVGPRPPLQSEVDEYADDIRRRLKVIPGVTGLWQVSGRSLLTWEESVRLDLRYVENWSMLLDLQILWKTAFAVLAKKGAY